MSSSGNTHPWIAFRKQMPVAERYAYFDHAAVSPLPASAQAAIKSWCDDTALHGDVHWPSWAAKVEQTRASAAKLLGAGVDEIALVRSTTEGITLVAEGYPWRDGDNVVTLADEFPSNLYPWMNLASRGVECRRVAVDEGRVDLDRIAAACDTRTRLIAVSWVGYSSGWRNDLDALAELAHARGAHLFVDAIQGLGVFPLDLANTPIDFLAADGHKWLLGPEGAGIFFVRREHLDLLRPLGVGWHSVAHSHDFTHIELKLKASAERYEGGTAPMPGLIGLGQSLELLLGHERRSVADRVAAMTDLACERLRAIGAKVTTDRTAKHRSGILSFELPGKDPVEQRRRCLEASVVLSCRGGKLRISPHAYNNADDVGRLAEALK